MPFFFYIDMNILLLGHRDVASNVALSLIGAGLPEHRFDVRLSGTVASRGESPAALRELEAYEERLCAELAESKAARRAGLLPFDELARQSGGTFGELPRPNEPEGLKALAACAPDLVISVRYRRILRAEAIAVPRNGVLNLHSGLLPEYKGVMATFWAMLNSEQIIGSTAHWIVDGTIDTGPVIGRAEITAEPGRSYLSNVVALYPSGCRLLVDAVNRIERGETIIGSRQEQAGRYYSAPAADDVARFRKAGLRLFDGNELQEFLRAL